MNLKQRIAMIAVGGAVLAGGVAFATPAAAATTHPTATSSAAARPDGGRWYFYNRYSSVPTCALAGAGLYHRVVSGYGYVQAANCYAAGSGYDLEIFV